jgi:hypothetical protein
MSDFGYYLPNKYRVFLASKVYTSNYNGHYMFVFDFDDTPGFNATPPYNVNLVNSY